MNDSFWGAIAKSWRDGWTSGGYKPSPAVGRGFFSNWFLSEQERETRDLQALYARVKQAHDASPFADDDGVFTTMTLLLQDIVDRAEISLNDRMIEVLARPLQRLLEEEFFAFPDLDEETSWRALSLEQSAHLRTYLLRKERFLAGYHHPFDEGCRKLAVLFAGVLGELSDDALALEETDQTLVFDALLADFLINPAQAIESTIGTITDYQMQTLELYCDLYAQLDFNTRLASGIEPWDTRSDRRYIMPTEAKGLSAGALVDAYLAHTPFKDFFEAALPVSIPEQVRFEHCHIVGGTGHGKTQLLQELIYHDLTRPAAPGVVVIDSQGDLIETLLRLQCFGAEDASGLADRLILIDPHDIEHPTALNMFAIDQERMAAYGPAERERVLNGAVDLYEHFFSSLLGAELTQKQGVVFRYLARLLIEIPEATIQTFRELMEDGAPYRPYMRQLEGSARRFFETEFFSPSFKATKTQILRRLWGVLANPAFERMFSSKENRIDLFGALNDGKIVLINTAKDLLKPEGCAIFGRFFIAKIAQAVMERAVIPEAGRRPSFVYIDEAHDYFDDSIEHLLNQARKYRVGLTLAHQNLDQLTPKLRASVLASTSVKFAGGLSAKDARALHDDFRTDTDFLSLMRKKRGRSEFACFVKNQTERALRISIELGRINALPGLSDGEREALIERNRTQYSAPDSVDKGLPTVAHGEIEELPAAVASRSTSDKKAPIAPASSDPLPRAARPQGGQGGREHTYLQHFVRTAAQERGWKADIEKIIPEGKIDVALEAGDLKVACEICVSTPLEYEMASAAKSLAAGYDSVWIVVGGQRKQLAFQKAINERSDLKGARVCLAEEVIDLLDQHAAIEDPSETKLRGYTVKVRRKAGEAEEAERRLKAIQTVLGRSISRKA